MAKIDFDFTNINSYYHSNKIPAIKAIREVTKCFLGNVMGLKEAKDLVETLIDGLPVRVTLLVNDTGKVSGFVHAANGAGFTCTCSDVSMTDPFKEAVIAAIHSNNFQFAAAMLQAKIKFGGAYEE